jgi:diguanylate cyclase (GGDEF)-like protein
MGLVEKLIGNGGGADTDPGVENSAESLTDGALDTLGCVLRTMGEAAFPTDKSPETEAFLAVCAAYAGHVENGASVPSAGIEVLPDGGRDWSQVRRFFIDRRYDERDFVTERLGNYRDVVEDLVAGLRQIGERDQATEHSIIECLATLENVVNSGELPELKSAINQAVDDVNATFARQRRDYEQQIDELNARMSCLRQDLVAAREEMKRDNLTEVFNRGAFDTGIEHCINMHFMSNQPVTLVLIDLDHFKQINDACGHSAGDAVLRAIGEALSRSFIRKSDLVCRYGGDEFAVILNDTASPNAAPLLERFLDLARKIEIPNSDGQARIGCSIGYTEIVASDSVESLINRADKALYEAKAAGRDQARFAAADEA